MTAKLDACEAEMLTGIAREPLVEQVLAWAAVNSGSNNLEGLERVAHLLSDAFSALPGKLELVGSAEASDMVGAKGGTRILPAGRHLVMRVRPNSKRRVLLTGHMDTVFGADNPFQACRWLDSERLNGPGVLDMKGGIAVMLAGLQAFETTSPHLGYDIIINSDEETGSASSSVLIAELARGKLAALTYEPTLPDGAIARARPGSGNFAAIVHGRAAHAGRNPEDGRNAIVAASDLALRLHLARRKDLSINPARIDGGGANNVVPSLATLCLNLRPRESEDLVEGLELVRRLADEVAADHEVKIEIQGGFGRPPKPVDPKTERLFHLVANAAAALGSQITWRDSGGVCDGNNIACCGVPVIDTMGACGNFIHSDQEYLDTMSLVPKAQLSALVLRRLEIAEGGI